MRRLPLSVFVPAVVAGLAACSSSPPKLLPAPRGTASARALSAPGVVPAPCTAETTDCDGDPANGCEARTRPASQCGPCGCPVGTHCRAGTCARDVRLSSAATGGHTCAIAPDGRVACWGSFNGTPFVADATPRWWPGMKEAVAVRTSGGRACAIDRVDAAFCDYAGKASPVSEEAVIDIVGERLLLADGRITNLTDTYRGFERALAMVENTEQVCVLLQEGQVSCFRSWWDARRDNDPRPEVFHKVGEVTHLAAGDKRMCVVSRPGNVVCWDYWVDDDRHDAWSDPVEKNGIEDAVEVAPGKRHTCALRKTGEVLCWGDGGSGELGDGTRHSSEAPVTVANLQDALHLVSGDGHSCAMRQNGQVVCWGTRRAGGLGDGRINVRVLPTEIEGIDDAVSVSGARGRTCALRRSGKVACWGLGGLASGPPGSPVRGLPPVEVPGLTNIRSLTVRASACAADDQGRVFCWPGAAPNVPGRGPVRIEGLPPATKVIGPDLVYDRWPVRTKDQVANPESGVVAPIGIALLKSGEVALFRLEGGPVDGVRHARTSIVSGLTDIADVDESGEGGCVVRRNGTIACFRYPSDDRLDKPKRVTTIRPISGIKDAIQMDGSYMTTRVGAVFHLRYSYRARRVDVEPWAEVEDVAEVRDAEVLSCARLRSGKVFCEGWNEHGQRGIGDTTDQDKHGTFVLNLDDAVSLSVTRDQACAVRKTGRVVCWGSNELDQTGGDAPFAVVPQDVSFPPD